MTMSRANPDASASMGAVIFARLTSLAALNDEEGG
jgi:hypothetical protein